MKTYFGDQEINTTGVSGNKNINSVATDLPEFASSNTTQYGINKDYFYAFARGESPHPFYYMTSGTTNNIILNTSIRNDDASPGVVPADIRVWFMRMVAGAFIIMSGDIQRINIALKSTGFTGIPASPIKSYSTARAANVEPGWSAGDTTVFNTGSGGFGEIGEIAKDEYGTGGTNSRYGYIYSPNITLPSGVTASNPIVSDSRNTHSSITSRGIGNNRLGIPYAVGKHSRLEYAELKLKEVLDYLNLSSDPEPYQASIESPDSRTIRLYSQVSGSTSNIYTTGYMDDIAGPLYPVATLAAVTAGGRLDITLSLRREPAGGVNVIVPVDDTGSVDWSVGAMDSHPWKVSLNGQIIACAGVVQTLIGNSYVALWKLYIRNVNTSAPASGMTARSIAILEEYGNEFYMNTNAVGITEITFKTSAGKLQNSLPAEFYKKGAIKVSTILIAAS